MTINETLFKLSADHLIRQGEVSENKEEFRVYRCHSTGRMCAVGVLIHSEFYDPEFEGNPIENKVLNAIALSNCVDPNDIDIKMLAALQTIHDYVTPDNWGIYLENKAKELGFNWTPPEVSVS